MMNFILFCLWVVSLLAGEYETARLYFVGWAVCCYVGSKLDEEGK